MARKALPEVTYARIFKQVISALKACHEINIAHRDLKPDNIMVGVSRQAVLIDFGLSTKHDKDNEVL